jgi:type IV pilus assembly protein PilY1
MTINEIKRLAICSVLAGTVVAPTGAAAADIDLYASGGSAGGAASLLFFLDNSSNWSAASQAWNITDVQNKCKAYTDATAQKECSDIAAEVFGSDTSLVQGQVEVRALRLVLNKLICASSDPLPVKIGYMLFNSAGTADSSSGVSGYIRRAVETMDKARCDDIIKDLTEIDAKITTPDFKGPSSAEYGAPLYEAFKYFGGFTNPAGVKADGNNVVGGVYDATHFGPMRYGLKTVLEDPKAFTDPDKRETYNSPTTDTCGKNFIVVIGNTWPNQEYGTDTNAPKYPTNLLMQRLAYDPGKQKYPDPLPNSEKTNVRFADEWAQFLRTTDVSPEAGTQNVSVYTVDVYNKTADAKQGALLKYMADPLGSGAGYFKVGGDIKALVDAIKDILIRVTAVNSVFTSASLPVSVNAQGTFLNQIFMGVFRPDQDGQQRWYGNLKQYQLALSSGTLSLVDATGNQSAVDTVSGFVNACARSFWTTDSSNYWEKITGVRSTCISALYASTSPYSDTPDGPIVERGGAAQKLRAVDPTKRNIRTCPKDDCSSGLADFSSSTVPSLSATLVDWVRGLNNGDYTSNATGTNPPTTYGMATTVARPTVHGEVVHSRPLAVNYGVDGAENVVVFYGSGDGMLHAVDGNQTGLTAGSELWSFIAPEHWTKLDRVRTNSPLIAYPGTPVVTPAATPKDYFFDGSIGGYQERTAKSVDKLWIYPTMRRGGRAVYAFDVTNRPGASSQPTLMWKYTDDATYGDKRMGQSWSTPLAFRVKGLSDPLLVFGAGYDDCEDSEDPNAACAATTKGRGIVVMNAKDGQTKTADYRFIDPGTEAGRFVADMALVDVNGDGYVDAIYAVDTRGNIWRINTVSPDFVTPVSVDKWPVVKIASVSDWSSTSEQRKFMYAPSTVVLGDQVMVLVGSGNREKPLDTSTASKVKNRFYGIRDDVKVIDPALIVVAIGYGATPSNLLDVTDKTGILPTDLVSYRGWFLDLVSKTAPYEQVVTTPLTIAGVTYFSTFQPKNSDAAPKSCLKSTARGYQIDFQTGTKLAGQDLTVEFNSPGFPPSPVGGVVKIDGQSVPFVIGGQGPTVLSPSKVVPNVKAYRKPIYRYQRIDG